MAMLGLGIQNRLDINHWNMPMKDDGAEVFASNILIAAAFLALAISILGFYAICTGKKIALITSFGQQHSLSRSLSWQNLFQS